LTTQLDLISVYALSDSSHEEEKKCWRDFLNIIAPALLECSPEETLFWAEESMLHDAEELFDLAKKLLGNGESKIKHPKFKEHDKEKIASQLYVLFSGEIAFELGLSREFGLAAFMEPTLPTKAHKIGTNFKRNKSLNKSKILKKWLERFNHFQQEEEFLKTTQEWKNLMMPFQFHEDKENSAPLSEVG
jgi:hypothetical protein